MSLHQDPHKPEQISSAAGQATTQQHVQASQPAQPSVPQNQPTENATYTNAPHPNAPYAYQPASYAPYTAAPSAQPKKNTKRTALIVCAVIAAVVLVGVLCGAAFQALFTADGEVAVINIDGTIGEDGGANSPEGLLSQLNQAEQDSSIAAVVLRVDSGGGGAAAGEEMATYVRDFSKPIVVSSGSSNCSAAYYISSQADWIMANQASSVGSIGTVMSLIDYSGLLTTLGIEVTNIASAESKDSSYGTRPLTKEEIAYYQDLVDEINSVFVQAVAQGRNMSVEDVEKLATGMPFTGNESVKNGLVDEIGTFEDALDKAASLAGLSTYTVVSLDDSTDLNSLLNLLSSEDAPNSTTEEAHSATNNSDSTSPAQSDVSLYGKGTVYETQSL